MVLPEPFNALTKATNFVSTSSLSHTNELILEALVNVILVHQLLLEKNMVNRLRAFLCFDHS